jgi:1,2-diacylglycerol 3-alpha-glucosyltransferase
MSRVAGVIVNLVPYHHARWEAFAQSSREECHLVELTDWDEFKVLEFSAAASYRRQTLFPRTGSETIFVRELRKVMTAKLNALRPDVVCVSGWALAVGLAALDWAVRNRVPAVVLSESNEFDEPRSAVKEFVKHRIVALCSAGLAGGTPQADYLSKLGLPRECIFKGYDVVDNGYFREKADSIERTMEDRGWVAGHSLPSAICHLPSSPFFLACARFGEKKNLPRLVEAYARYREIASKSEIGIRASGLRPPTSGLWSLVIAGDGEKREEIEAAIAHCGVSEFVHLAGAKSYADMPAFYGLASVFIHASTTEQWGLVVNEAMASGLPVLVSNRCGCARDLVQDGVNGFTFDPYNVEELAGLMLKVSAMPASSPPRSGRGTQGEVSPPSGSLSAFQDVSLSAFGDASRQIIANWGPERFAAGLEAAVDCALKIGPKRTSWIDRMLLKALLAR